MKEITIRLFLISGILIANMFSIHAADEESGDDQGPRVEKPFSAQIHRVEGVRSMEDANQYTRLYPLRDLSLSHREAHLSDLSVRRLREFSALEPNIGQILSDERLQIKTDYSRVFMPSLSSFHTLMAGGPPDPPDPLRELLKIDEGFRVSFERNFIRGNIQSFLGVINTFRHLYLFRQPHWSRFLQNYLLQPSVIFPFQYLNLDGTPPHAQDLENVMKTERIAKTEQAIKRIYDLLKGKDTSEALCIQELQQHLEYLSKSDRHPKYLRPSNGMNEITNAMLTLEGQTPGCPAIMEGEIYIYLEDETGDKSPVTMKSLLAKSWWLVTRQIKAEEQETVKETLTRSLGQCIEDDGHRVCDVGKSQRITTALQGYIEGIKIDNFDTPPDPNTFMSAFFTPKQKEIENTMNKTREEQRTYALSLFNEAIQQAQQVYSGSEREMREVTMMMKDFIKNSLDFEDDL